MIGILILIIYLIIKRDFDDEIEFDYLDNETKENL
jgi:hypothetical protein